MYIDDTISTVKSLVGFTDVTDICRPVMYTEFNTLIVEIKNLSMEDVYKRQHTICLPIWEVERQACLKPVWSQCLWQPCVR